MYCPGWSPAFGPAPEVGIAVVVLVGALASVVLKQTDRYRKKFNGISEEGELNCNWMYLKLDHLDFYL